MAENTKIEWCDHTFNPWRGCSKVHTGCRSCYAETLSKRNPGTLGVWGPNGSRVVASEAMWREPIKWNQWAKDGVCPNCHGKSTRDTAGKCRTCDGTGHVEPVRPRVFCASLADVFEDWQGPVVNSKGVRMSHVEGGCEVLDSLHDVRRRLFRLIDSTEDMDWLLLTKRPENVRKMWPTYFPGGYIAEAGSMNHEGPRSNCWLGTSVSDQATADATVPELLKCRDLAPVLFLSVEPLVGPVDLSKWLYLCTKRNPDGSPCGNSECAESNGIRGLSQIGWVIVGGESGPGARPCNVEWIRGIVRQCDAAGVPCFVKQVGSNPWLEPGELERRRSQPGYIPLRDKKGGDWNEWPEDIRIRQLPEAE